jgi:hypothetical protein
MIEDRSPYYKNLNIEQIQIADAFTEPEFENWVNGGSTKFALNQAIENKRARAHVGQTYAQNDGFNVIVPGLKTMKMTAPNETVTDLWASTFKQFNAKYPQYVDCPQNTELVNKFIRANRDALPEGLTVAPSVEAWESFFKICFSRLYLRRVTKVVNEPTTKLTNRRGQRAAVNPAFFPRPTTSELVETILSPRDVQNLSANETAVFMLPMSFPGVTDSASDYVQSDEFKAETPARQTRSQREQSAAQVEREVKLFAQAYPAYGKYFGDEKSYGGLYKMILDKIKTWGMLVTAESLLDGFKWAESEGLLKASAADLGTLHGQVATVHVTPDVRPGYWKNPALRRAVENMSADELQAAINSDPALRALIDGTA